MPRTLTLSLSLFLLAATPSLATAGKSSRAARQVIRILTPKGLARAGMTQQTEHCLAKMRRAERVQARGRLATLLTPIATLAAYAGAAIHFNAAHMPFELAVDQVFHNLATDPGYAIGAVTVSAMATAMVKIATTFMGRGGMQCSIPELKQKNVAEMEQMHARALLAMQKQAPARLSQKEEGVLKRAAAALREAR